MEKKENLVTHRERWLKAARGESVDQLPWVPRIDLWYNVNSKRGTFPSKFGSDATLDEISDSIGGGCHKIIPDFLHNPDDIIDRGLGIYRHLRGIPYLTKLPSDVTREVKRENNMTTVSYHTPVGDISCKFGFTEGMKQAGASIAWIYEHAIKQPKDYKIVGYIFKNIKIVPDYNNYLKLKKGLGERGVAVAYSGFGAGPMHHIMKHMDPSIFFLEMFDHPKELRQLCEDMDPYFDQLFQVLADCPSEITLFGANYDEAITYPPFFRKYIMPYTQKLAEILHSKGKLLLMHCDGENQELLDLYPDSGMDVAEAICVKPMTRETITEIKRAFKGKITIFGGVPSIVLMEESMSDSNFENFMKELFKEIAPGERFILGVSDTTPPDAKFERLERITEMVENWGKFPMDPSKIK